MASMSLRSVAREVGMSPSGLQKFMDGSVPYLPTRQKLERWYVRETARSGDEMSLEVAMAALHLLVDDLPLARRRRALLDLVATLEAAYNGAEAPLPSWLEDLFREARPEGGG